MNSNIKNEILNKIKEYDKIIISRHSRPDGDAVGSTKGLYTVLKDTFPNKKIYLVNDDYAEYLTFLGDEDKLQPDEYKDALIIILDTGTEARISNENAHLAKEMIKIDHHVDIAPYGDISWVEDQRSSCCEMIADLLYTFKDELVITKEAATFVYTGMVTDSGRFRHKEVSGETMRMAGFLLDLGIDTETLFANLYLDDFSAIKFKAYFLNKIKRTKNGVAYLYIDKASQEKFGMSTEEASALVSTMDSIKDSLIWIAFIDYPDGSIRARLRSRFVKINKLAENYHGGGHEYAAGATAYSKEEKARLIREADKLIKDYKENNKGWL